MKYILLRSVQSWTKCIQYKFPFSTADVSAESRSTLSQVAADTAMHQNNLVLFTIPLFNEYYSVQYVPEASFKVYIGIMSEL